jgi:hypothetical protein
MGRRRLPCERDSGLRRSNASRGGLAFMPQKGLLTAQLGAGGMRLTAGGIFNAFGWTRYQGDYL